MSATPKSRSTPGSFGLSESWWKGTRAISPARSRAGDAAHASPAGLEATAAGHLLDLPHKLHRLLRGPWPDKDRQKRVQGQTRAEIKRAPAVAHDPILPLEVALLADRFPQLGGEMA